METGPLQIGGDKIDLGTTPWYEWFIHYTRVTVVAFGSEPLIQLQSCLAVEELNVKYNL